MFSSSKISESLMGSNGMKSLKVSVNIPAVLSGIIAAVLLLVPFHAFLTVWLASMLGHYTLLRLWKEFLLIILTAGSVYLLVKNPKLRWKLISYKLHWLIAVYALVQLIWGVVALLIHQVDAKALGYAWIINVRFLLFFLVVWATATQFPALTRKWPRWVVWPAVVVVVVGLLQYFVLPYDVLRHVGYNQSTIYPYETINHSLQHIRIMSTLRGANPLGAYLIVVLSLLVVLWRKHKNIWYGLLLVGGAVTLFLSFSRSAWIGMVLSIGVLLWTFAKTKRAKQYAIGSLALVVLLAGAIGLGLRHNTSFQDALLHTNDHSKIATSSNQGHVSALRSGVMDLLKDPFGRGPGSAGPASVYNNHPVRIAENYFIQIGQETGWIGLLVFVAINIVLARALWRRRHQSLALGLLAALIGLTFVNLLSHAWADDTLAYLWWGLAGLAVAVDLKSQR